MQNEISRSDASPEALQSDPNMDYRETGGLSDTEDAPESDHPSIEEGDVPPDGAGPSAIGHAVLPVLAATVDPEAAKTPADRVAPKTFEVVIPGRLTMRQARAFLRDEVEKAADAGDLNRVRALNAALRKLDSKEDRRAGRDGVLRKVLGENPYVEEIVELYRAWTIWDVLMKFAKACRFDFGHKGLVGGIAELLDTAARSAGGTVDLEVLRAQTKAMAWKLKQRTHGLGTEFVRDANQVLRIQAEELGRPRVPEEKWLKRHPLPTPEQWEVEFAADWDAWTESRNTVTGEGG